MIPLYLSKFGLSDKTQWQQRAATDLHGKSLKNLNWSFDPDVIVEPYYDQSDSMIEPAAGMHSAHRENAGFSGSPWSYLHSIQVNLPGGEKEYNTLALNALNNGADGLLWELPASHDINSTILFNEIGFPFCQTVFKLSSWSQQSASLLAKLINNNAGIAGWLYYDPRSNHPLGLEALRLLASAKHFRPLCFDGTEVAIGSLAPSAQVGYLLSEFIERMRFLVASNVGPELLDQCTFCLSSDRDYFHNIAKIRALKLVIAQAAVEFGDREAKPSDVKIFMDCGDEQYSVVDPHVNLLRATASTMSSIIGGAAYVTTSPFDNRYPIAQAGLSERLSRNISSILRHESHFDKHGDPAAGSYFIESLTGQLAERGWAVMQEAESTGGFSAALGSGYFARKRESFQQREGDLVTSRRLSYVGVNNFCDLTLFNSFPSPEELEKNFGKKDADPSFSAFERLRVKTENHIASTASMSRPSVSILRFGDMSAALVRSQFVKNLLPTAGIGTQEPLVWGQDDINLTDLGKILFLCSSDPDYVDLGKEIFGAIKSLRPSLHLCVAGNPGVNEETLRSYGIDSFVHSRSNFPEVLSYYQQLLGI